MVIEEVKVKGSLTFRCSRAGEGKKGRGKGEPHPQEQQSKRWERDRGHNRER